jgi:hypothetical protein
MQGSHARSRDPSSRDLSISPRAGPRASTRLERGISRDAQAPVNPRVSETHLAASNSQGLGEHRLVGGGGGGGGGGGVSSTQLPVTQLSSRSNGSNQRTGRPSPPVLASDSSSDDQDDLVPSGRPRLGNFVGEGARRNATAKQNQAIVPNPEVPTTNITCPRRVSSEVKERFRDHASPRNATKQGRASGDNSRAGERFREPRDSYSRSYAEKMAVKLTSAKNTSSVARNSPFVGRNHYTPAQMRARADLDSSSDG